MAKERIYLFNPNDTLALAQSIEEANKDNVMSYVISDQGNSTARAKNKQLELLYTVTGVDPENRKVGDTVVSYWDTAGAGIKELILKSIIQSPPKNIKQSLLSGQPSKQDIEQYFDNLGANEVEIIYISSEAYPTLANNDSTYNNTPVEGGKLFIQGQWKSARPKISVTWQGAFPNFAYGGSIETSIFVDAEGHYVAPTNKPGQTLIYPNLLRNQGTFGVNPSSIAQFNEASGRGLKINAPGQPVTLINYSVTSQAFGIDRDPYSVDGILDGSTSKTKVAGAGEALEISAGDVTLGGSLSFDQLIQTTLQEGTAKLLAPVVVRGKQADVTVENATINLGSVRGYEAVFRVDGGASATFNDSTIYGYTSSNSDAPVFPFWNGLVWQDIQDPSFSPEHLIVANDGSIALKDSKLLREEQWQPTGPFAENGPSFWRNNDLQSTNQGSVRIQGSSTLTIDSSYITADIDVDGSSGAILDVSDSTLAGERVNSSEALVRLINSPKASIENSQIDSIDFKPALSDSTPFSFNETSHVLRSNSQLIPILGGSTTFADPTNTPITIQSTGDKGSGRNINFQFQGSTQKSALATSQANQARTLDVAIQEDTQAPNSSGGITHSLRATFSEPVTGFEDQDLLNSINKAAGWSIASSPRPLAGNKVWLFSLEASSRSSDLTFKLLNGAADSKFASALHNQASAPITLSGLSSSGSTGGSGSTASASPHILAITMAFGTELSAKEAASAQAIVVDTDAVPDGTELVLKLGAFTKQGTVHQQKASFSLDPSELSQLKVGLNTVSVSEKNQGAGSLKIPSLSRSFSVDGLAPAATPHLQIVPGFGSILSSQSMLKDQTININTTGFNKGDQLTLKLDGQSPAAISGGVVNGSGLATFTLPTSILSGLAAGAHQLQVSGPNAPDAVFSFTAEGTHVAAPHITSIIPSFGARLSAQEASVDQTIEVGTDAIADGNTIQVAVLGQQFSATVNGNKASVTLPATALQSLPPGTDLITVNGPIGAALQAPPAQQSFFKEDAGIPAPHVLSITPSFGHILDASEITANQTVTITTEHVADTALLQLGLNGVTYSPDSFSAGRAVFSLPAADLAALQEGAIAITASGVNAGVAIPPLSTSIDVDLATTPALSPHITTVTPDFGAVLELNERGSDHSIIVQTTDIADGSLLNLVGIGSARSVNVKANQAVFSISAQDLNALPDGLNTITILDANGTAQPLNFSFSVQPPLATATPHVLGIVSSFGSVLSTDEKETRHTIEVTTDGVEDNQTLTLSAEGLQLQGNVKNNRAIFELEPQQLKALPTGLDHFIATVSNRAGTEAPAGRQSFSVEGNIHNNAAHIDAIDLSFGSILKQNEKKQKQRVSISTTGFSKGDSLDVSIAGNPFTAEVNASGKARLKLLPQQLQLLPAGVDQISVSGTNSAGVSAPVLQRSFSVDGNHLPGHFTSIDPSFGATLDPQEAATEQTINVIAEGLPNGQAIRLALNGRTYKSTINDNFGSFELKSKQLQKLPLGLDQIKVSAPKSDTPQALQAFTVVENSAPPQSNGAKVGLILEGTPQQDLLEGSNGDDIIHGHQSGDRLLGHAGDDTIKGGHGSDTLHGGHGSDLLRGGHGGDQLTGGKGSDLFIYKHHDQSLTDRGPSHQDVITDLSANDRIDLSHFEEKLSFIASSAFSNTPGEVRFAGQKLQADLNGNGSADFLVHVQGDAVTAAHLIL